MWTRSASRSPGGTRRPAAPSSPSCRPRTARRRSRSASCRTAPSVQVQPDLMHLAFAVEDLAGFRRAAGEEGIPAERRPDPDVQRVADRLHRRPRGVRGRADPEVLTADSMPDPSRCRKSEDVAARARPCRRCPGSGRLGVLADVSRRGLDIQGRGGDHRTRSLGILPGDGDIARPGRSRVAFTLTAGSAFEARMGICGVVAGGLRGDGDQPDPDVLAGAGSPAPLRWSGCSSAMGYRLPKVDRSDITDLIVILRVTPGFPFFVQNYLLGLAGAPAGEVFSDLGADDASLHGGVHRFRGRAPPWPGLPCYPVA